MQIRSRAPENKIKIAGVIQGQERPTRVGKILTSRNRHLDTLKPKHSFHQSDDDLVIENLPILGFIDRSGPEPGAHPIPTSVLLPTRTYLHKSHNLSTSVFLPAFF